MQRFRDYRLLLVRDREDGLPWGVEEGNGGREEGRGGREDFWRSGQREEDALFQEPVCLGQELSTMSSISTGSSEGLEAKTASPLGDHYIPLFHEWQTDRETTNPFQDYRIDCLSSDRHMLQLPPCGQSCQQSQQEMLEMMFQDEYRDLFQSSLSEISLKESLDNPIQLTQTISEQLTDEHPHNDKPSQRFMRILDVLNQSDPSFRGRQQQRPTPPTQRVKGRTMIVLPKKDKDLEEIKNNTLKQGGSKKLR